MPYIQKISCQSLAEGLIPQQLAVLAHLCLTAWQRQLLRAPRDALQQLKLHLPHTSKSQLEAIECACVCFAELGQLRHVQVRAPKLCHSCRSLVRRTNGACLHGVGLMWQAFSAHQKGENDCICRGGKCEHEVTISLLHSQIAESLSCLCQKVCKCSMDRCYLPDIRSLQSHRGSCGHIHDSASGLALPRPRLQPAAQLPFQGPGTA